jgi:hypothetical protein
LDEFFGRVIPDESCGFRQLLQTGAAADTNQPSQGGMFDE